MRIHRAIHLNDFLFEYLIYLFVRLVVSCLRMCLFSLVGIWTHGIQFIVVIYISHPFLSVVCLFSIILHFMVWYGMVRYAPRMHTHTNNTNHLSSHLK